MKKLLFIGSLTLSIVITSFSLQAQDLKYGVKIGSNFATQSNAGGLYDNEDINTGLHAGIFANLSLNERIKLQTEINYDQKGSAGKNITNSYNYLTVPVLAKFSLGKSNNTPLSFNVYAGPYAAFLLNAESEISLPENDATIDMKDQTENFEAGIIGGFGLAYPINDKNIFLDFRLGLGLNSFDKNNDDLRNKYFGVNLGFEF